MKSKLRKCLLNQEIGAWRGYEKMMIGASIIASMLTSAITTKILAVYYFKIVDGYVKAVCDLTNESNKSTLATVRKLTQREGSERSD